MVTEMSFVFHSCIETDSRHRIAVRLSQYVATETYPNFYIYVTEWLDEHFLNRRLYCLVGKIRTGVTVCFVSGFVFEGENVETPEICVCLATDRLYNRRAGIIINFVDKKS
jgi:hypothetical protein